jgi:uncharacterized membrane protein (Fun14 family)
VTKALSVKIVEMSIKQHSIELLGILATVFGSFFMNTIILIMADRSSHKGFQMVYLNLLVFCAWYLVVGILISIAHPKPSKYVLLIIGVLVAAVLILTSQGWIDPNIDLISKINSWLIGYANYIIVIPVFFVIGMCAEKCVHAQSRYT